MGYVLCLMAGAMIGMFVTCLIVANNRYRDYDEYDIENEEDKDADR